MPETEKPALSYLVKGGLLFIGWFVSLVTMVIFHHGGVVSAKVSTTVDACGFGVLFFGELALAASEVRREGRGGGPTVGQQRRKAERSSRKFPAGQAGTPGWSQRGGGAMSDTGYRGTPFIVRVFALAGIWFAIVLAEELLVSHGILAQAWPGVIAVLLAVLFLFALIIWSVTVADHRRRDGIGAGAGRGKAYFAQGAEVVPVYHPQVIAPSQAVAASYLAQARYVPSPHAAPQVAQPPVVVAPLAPLYAPPVIAAPPAVDLSDPERVNDILGAIESMPGMGHVGHQIRKDVAVLESNKAREERGEPVLERSLHTLFLGPPGTGKTTIAGLYAKIFCALGVLPTDRCQTVRRPDLIGEHVGETAPRVREVVEGIQGGTLFIDEAYSLMPGHGSDFSHEANAELLALMEDKRSTFAVIAAGYGKEMEAWLSSNPGLRSRFSRTLTFAAYDGGTLFQIAETKLGGLHLALDTEARNLLATHLARVAVDPTSANGRTVRQIVDDLYEAQAVRLGESGRLGDAAARRAVTVDDVEVVVGAREDSP